MPLNGLRRRTARRQDPVVLEPAAAYALWAPNYPPQPHNRLMAAEQALAAPLIAAAAPVRALDVGTGSGRYLPVLVGAGARLAVGIDLSMPMLTRNAHGHPVVCADACRLPFATASFDLVTAFLTVGDVPHLDRWIGEMARVLTPGGRLLYSDFHPEWTRAGWLRTFATADGRAFAVGYHPHELTDHTTALQRHGFDLRAVYAPPIAVPRRWLLRRRTVPAVVMFHAVKYRFASAGSL